MKIGLVLSGGGAKGAYQAGVVRALASYGVEVSAIAGASIGSLNGAIISASPNLSAAADRLVDVWNHVAEYSPIELDLGIYPKYLALLGAAGLTGPGRAGIVLLNALAASLVDREWVGLGDAEDALLKDQPLSDLLDKHLEVEALANGTPLYVSLYPHTTSKRSIRNVLLGDSLGRFDTEESVFLRVQELPRADQFQALLASAAIPVLFRPKKVQGTLYSDGGQGNYRKVQGNTPITPLLGLGLDLIIVTHLSDGSFWDVEDFPGENILEIRPAERISENGSLDMLGFKEETIKRWMEQGRLDTERYLKKIARIGNARQAMHASTQVISAQLKKSLANDDLEHAMARLKTRKTQ